jgi:hypothetical protein
LAQRRLAKASRPSRVRWWHARNWTALSFDGRLELSVGGSWTAGNACELELLVQAWGREASGAAPDRLSRSMHNPIAKTGAWVKQMLQGHLNYFAVSGNDRSLWWFFKR